MKDIIFQEIIIDDKDTDVDIPDMQPTGGFACGVGCSNGVACGAGCGHNVGTVCGTGCAKG